MRSPEAPSYHPSETLVLDPETDNNEQFQPGEAVVAYRNKHMKNEDGTFLYDNNDNLIIDNTQQGHFESGWTVGEYLDDGRLRIYKEDGELEDGTRDRIKKDVWPSQLKEWQEEAEKQRATAELSDDDYRDFIQNELTPSIQRLNGNIPVESVDSATKIPVKNPHFLQFVEEDDRNHAEKQAREEANKFRVSKVLKKAFGRRAVRPMTESLPNSESNNEQENDNEQGPERPRRLERIKNLISRGKEAAANKFSRRDDKRLLRMEAKAGKLEEKRLKVQKKADALYDAIEAEKYDAMRDEANRDNKLFDAHEEAIEMDKSFPMLKEAHEMNDAFDEAKAKAEREAKLQAARENIRKAAQLEADAVLARALEEMDRIQKAGNAKADSYDGSPTKRNRVRSRIARALNVNNRQ